MIETYYSDSLTFRFRPGPQTLLTRKLRGAIVFYPGDAVSLELPDRVFFGIVISVGRPHSAWINWGDTVVVMWSNKSQRA